MAKKYFPQGFIWGAATSAQQIEGASSEDGRAPSIWDTFAAGAGHITDGSRPDIACDHYHRWREDIALLSDLGLGAYRFSIAWPRVLPLGGGPVNEAGLDFYDRLVDQLLAAGLEPFPTLYHWDLPQALQDAGGWANRDTAHRFAEYTAAVTRRLGDRVSRWTTHNEPWCAATLGHEEGCHAPGLKDPATALVAAHHMLLSHGLATAVIRREVPRAEVGIVLINCPSHPATDRPRDVDAARWFDGFFNRWYLDPIFRGEYPADAVADRVAAGHLANPEPEYIHPGDLATISAPLDFLGVNYYSRNVMRAAADGKPEAVAPTGALTDMDWEVYPRGLEDALLRIHKDYAPPAIYITENGAAYDDPAGPDGAIRDERRIRYLHDHLAAVRRAAAAGAPVRGYFVWTLLDNFEWSYGFSKKFGLYAVDPGTLDRKPRLSAHWYRNLVMNNALDDELTLPTEGDFREPTDTPS